MKAERKWGELLGKAEHGGDRKSDQVTDSNLIAPPAERKAAHEARKLSHVDEPVFEEYVNQTDAPTKAGLLRFAAGAALAAGATHDQAAEVVGTGRSARTFARWPRGYLTGTWRVHRRPVRHPVAR